MNREDLEATMETQDVLRRVDPRSVAITGLTTLAWYAVPDAVGPRWARALAKCGVLVGGLALGVAVTSEGRQAVDGVRGVRDELRDSGTAAGSDADSDADRDAGRDADARDDNVLAGDLSAAADASPSGAAAGSAALGVVAFAVAVAVAGEKWAYWRGERWRARGLRLPHTRVGLILGALAAAATAVDPTIGFRAVDGDAVDGDEGTRTTSS